MGDITENRSVSLSKQGAGVSSAEVPRKLCVYGMLGGGVSTCNA